MLDDGRCWRVCGKICPYGKQFLEQLYSWSEENPLNPMLVWKICDPCHYDGKVFESVQRAFRASPPHPSQ